MPISHNRQLPSELAEYIKSHNEEDIRELHAIEKEDAKIRNLINEQIVMESKTLMYDTNCPIPGQPVEVKTFTTDFSDNELKAEAEKNLIITAANHKLKKEQLAAAKRPIDERVKEFYINSIINQQKTEFFNKNGYNISGKQLRNYRRVVIGKYNRGQIKPTPKEYEDIVAYLNSPLNDPNNKKVNPMKKEQSTSQQIGSLMSMI